MIEMIEHRRIDSIEVAFAADVQAQRQRISGRRASRCDVARDLEIADGSAEILRLPLRGQRQKRAPACVKDAWR